MKCSGKEMTTTSEMYLSKHVVYSIKLYLGFMICIFGK